MERSTTCTRQTGACNCHNFNSSNDNDSTWHVADRRPLHCDYTCIDAVLDGLAGFVKKTSRLQIVLDRTGRQIHAVFDLTLCCDLRDRIPERSSHNILPMEGLAGKISSSLHEYNFACYNCINGITSTADEYNFTSYNCISNV